MAIFEEYGGSYDIFVPADLSLIDTWVNEGAITTSNGSNVLLSTRDASGLLRYSIIKFDDIPVIYTTIWLKIVLSSLVVSGDVILAAHRLITPIITEGVTSTPCVDGGATWRRSVDYNGAGGDVTWAGGDISSSDFSSAHAACEVTIPSTAVDGNEFYIDITPIVEDWRGGESNEGILLRQVGTNFINFHSKDAALSANHPNVVAAGNDVGEYGTNYDYGDSPKYKDEEFDALSPAISGSAIFNGLLVSI